MRRAVAVVLAATVAVAVGLGLGYGLWSAGARSGPELESYQAHVTPAQLRALIAADADVAMARPARGGYDVQLVLTAAQRRALVDEGITTQVWRDPQGRTITQLSALQQQGGFQVWRAYDGDEGIRAEMYRFAQEHPDLAKIEVIGQTVQGREILAMKVTKDAGDVADGTRPAVLYSALQHAREWIGLEVARRLMYHLVEGYGQDPAITKLVDTSELWFVLVANPDGYQRTFDPSQRQWRKNVRDNNGDGAIDANNDGVDPNRNFDGHWGYDLEGSSTSLSNPAFRGPSAASEPETQAMQGLLGRVGFRFHVNYHSVAELILYPEGWQDQTPSVDHPIFLALSGTPANPAIPGFTPGLSASLYITNGETCDYAYDEHGTLCWTPELSDGGSGGGFVFPDDEALVQQEFEKVLPFAMDVAQSTLDPASPVSHLGNTVAPMYPDAFTLSYGDPQVVQVNAQRKLGPVTLKWRVNGRVERQADTAEWAGGERYGVAGSAHYHRLRGTVANTRPGDQVAVWFEGGGQATAPFTYTVASDSGRPVLVIAAEDYTGTAPDHAKTDGPSYLGAYLVALEEAGLPADVWDVDARGRQAPSALGVLSHYRAVVWYTGDDIVPRAPGMADGTVDTWANALQLAVRDYLNEGGKLLLSGKYAGTPYFGGYPMSPDPANPCNPAGRSGHCDYLVDDFVQYYLGAYRNLDNAGTAPDGKVRGVVATTGPLAGITLTLGSGTGAANQDHSMGLMPTSRDLPVDEYPQFASDRAAIFDNPALAPHSGTRFAYSGYTSRGYQRLTRTLDLSGTTSARLEFWASLSTSNNRGFVLVEAHTPGQDDWTTLSEANGRTNQMLPGSCPMLGTHAQLRHYLTQEGQPGQQGAKCLPQGTSGAWYAATGNSAGWQPWSVDLSAYAGKQVELSISYVTNVARLGFFLDDVTVTVDGRSDSTSFEDGPGAWAYAPAPTGSPANPVELAAAGADAVPVSAVVTTADTVFLGFGFEAVSTVRERTDLMCRAMDHLLGGTLPCAHPVVKPPALYLPMARRP